MRLPNKQRQTLKGFTLIELLVVIAIIALLAAIMVPSMSGTIEKGRAAACASNLRQISIASAGYEVDNDGDLPTPLHNGGTRHTWWPNTITPYLNMLTFNQGMPSRPSAITCPTQFRYLKSSRWTYSENFRLDKKNQLSMGNPGKEMPVNRNLMLRPAQNAPRWPVSETTLPYFMDGYTTSTTMFQSYRYRHSDNFMNNDGVTRSYPHDLAANVMFLDGHAEKLVRGEELWLLPGDSSVTSRYLDNNWAF